MPATMAAILRQGARRIGGTPLQRAFAEERRRLEPRRMLTTGEQEVHEKTEELYEALSKVEGWGNRRLLQHLAVRVNPRPRDIQWNRLRASKWAFNVFRVVAHASFAFGVATCLDALGLGRKVKR
ncbi:unnamed protein product [Alopecurus aequalis]